MFSDGTWEDVGAQTVAKAMVGVVGVCKHSADVCIVRSLQWRHLRTDQLPHLARGGVRTHTHPRIHTEKQTSTHKYTATFKTKLYKMLHVHTQNFPISSKSE